MRGREGGRSERSGLFLVIFELADHFDDYMLVVSFEKGSGLAIAMR